MRIEISKKTDGTFLADCTDLVGSPPIGSGPDKFSAIGNLFLRLSKEIEGMSGLTYMQKYFSLDVKFNENNEPETHEEVHEMLWDSNVSYIDNTYHEVVCE